MPASEKGGFPDQILDDPRIVGVDLGGAWGEAFETTEGVYDWSAVDSELAKAESHGKKVLLRINSGGINVPAWLLANPDVQTFSFIDQNPYHSTYGEVLTMPVFWDPIFLEKKLALIAAAGAHFADHSSIVVVTCSFANATTGDWNIPSTAEDIVNWRAAGYSTDLMVATGKLIVDATMAAFPNQNVSLAIGSGTSELDPSKDYLAAAVVDYAEQTYGRFITQKNSLSATTSDPALTSSLGNWQVVFDHTPNAAAQMLWNVSNDTTGRMSGGLPGAPDAILLQAITTGAHYGTQYQEIYETDLTNADLSGVIDAASALLTATPPLPAAPDTLEATSGSPGEIVLTWNDNADNELGYRVESKAGVDGTYQIVSTFGPGSTSVELTRLIEGTGYYFRVQAVNAAGLSGYSNEASTATVLDAPGGLTAQATSSSEVNVTWLDNSATEDGFTIERSPITDTDFAVIASVSANTTSFADSGLNDGTQYWYRVRAFNAATASDYSHEKQVTTLHDLPGAPSNLGVSSISPNKVSLTWADNSDDETGFKLQRKIGSTGTFTDIKTTVANVIAYTNSALLDGASYSYRLCATNSAGDSVFSNEIAVTTTLNFPSGMTAKAISSSQITLTWVDRSATEDGFTIERSPVTNTNFVAIATVSANATSFTDAGLTGGSKYWYRVRAFNANTTSAYSNQKQATTLKEVPIPPSALTITSLLSNKVSLSWSDNSANESNFKVQRKAGASGTYADIKTTAANITSYTDQAALMDGTSYFYRVCATNSAGDSAYSPEVNGVTLLAKPTSAVATALSSSRIDLSWADNSSSETGYKIERKTTAAGTFAQVAEVGAGVRSYSDTTGLDPATRYYYRVRATNGTTDSDYSNEPFAVTFR